MDTKPKKLSKSQKNSLKKLAQQVYYLFELRKSKLKIKTEKQQFKRFAELSPNIFYRYSSNSKLIYHSPIVEDILGYSPTAFKNDPNLWLTLIHPDDIDLVNNSLKSAKNKSK
ncbi:MAG: PAS domain-containing protein [Flavobacteriaceae bacterium]|nr:PAS domain-containing protein [Flavobacteriaceae bacterium]